MECQLLDHMSYKRFCGLANAINIPNRQSRKVHLGINAQTLEIRAIEVTCNNVGDAPILPELLTQIATPIASVTGDGAYDTKAFHAAIAAVGAAVITPSHKNARLWKKFPREQKHGTNGSTLNATKVARHVVLAGLP